MLVKLEQLNEIGINMDDFYRVNMPDRIQYASDKCTCQIQKLTCYDDLYILRPCEKHTHTI